MVSQHHLQWLLSLSMYVQKLSLNLNACAQSNWNQNFLVLVFYFIQSVGRSITADQKCMGSGDETGPKQYMDLCRATPPVWKF